MKTELETYLLQALNMALQINGETSYTNSFDVTVVDEGFYFIPRLPASYVIDDDLYQKIFQICNAALYPDYTMLKQTGAYFVPLDTEDIHVKRALFFPWTKGISKRLQIADIERFISLLEPNKIPIMKNLSFDYSKVTSIAIAGNSGSGKSYMLTYLLYVLKKNSSMVIVDPKFDIPSRWGRDNGIKVIAPSKSSSKSDFVSAVNAELSSCLDLIRERQQELYNDPNAVCLTQ